ncbi:MAG: NAD(P)/FAD-dependent oxidoreductase [Rhodobacteraceae bacterium]|nr:NAD(P)/FAD-dependent oxidoreductase [Paracoccaceae bacterium]
MKHSVDLLPDPLTTVAPLDLLIIGAGLSGICQAWHFQQAFPAKSYAIVEARAASGGTWDVFRYPGVRSDSDMQTLGYSFRPWTARTAIADGAAILSYLRETAAEAGIDRHIRYRQRVTSLSWNSATALWTATIRHDAAAAGQTAGTGIALTSTVTARFVVNCAGYYDHDAGHSPDWPSLAQFQGRVIHPQHWPADADVTGAKVVVIGSGATAVTLIPQLAKTAASVVMLQRSPGYVFAMPSDDAIGATLRRLLGNRIGHALTRGKNVLFNTASYQLAKRAPALARRVLLGGLRKALGPGFDVARHFTPRYAPWDQRICVAPDGDFFATLRAGRATVVTDTITGFTPRGITLAGGQQLAADLIITATGLTMRMGGGIPLTVDGQRRAYQDSYIYKGALYTGLPNFAVALGYVNASWTLKSELIARYVVRLIRHMDKRGFAFAVPATPPEGTPARPTFDLTSGYITRARGGLPHQADHGPWKLNQDYLKDLWLMTHGPLTDQMHFGHARITVP